MNPVLQDYQRLVHEAGHVLLRDWNCLRVTGRDRASFLNNLCTNEVLKRQPGEGCEAFFTDVKGHTLGHVMLLCRPDEILLWTAPGQGESLMRHLDKYIIREDVFLTDITSDAQLVAVIGPGAWQVIGSDSAVFPEPLTSREVSVGDVTAIAARCGWFGPAAVVLQVATESVRSLSNWLEQKGARAADAAALEVLRVESGTPLFGVDFDAHNLPQELNRNERAIHFQKGCYLGQETVARIDALGHVNKLLVGVRFAAKELPPVGIALRAADKEVGKVTSSIWSPRANAPLALAMVRRGTNAPGATLDSNAGPAEVISLPPLLDVER
jgi:tRNA-modifying protein YgfZ